MHYTVVRRPLSAPPQSSVRWSAVGLSTFSIKSSCTWSRLFDCYLRCLWAVTGGVEMEETNGSIIRSSDYARSIRDDDSMLLLRDDVLPYAIEIASALKKDDFNELVKVVEDREKLVCLQKGGYLIHPSLIFRWTIVHRALRCAESLLSAHGCLSALGVEHIPVYVTPLLHQAVTEFLPDFVELFLKNRADLNLSCLKPLSEYYMMKPMDAGIKALRKKILWMPTQSLHELIFSICGMELEQARCAISHVMRASEVEDIENAIYHYAGEGKIAELAILLYVDATSAHRTFESMSNDEYLALCKFVDANISTCSTKNGVSVSIGKERVLMLLKLFYLAKFSILGYNPSQDILTKRMLDSGFDLSNGEVRYIGNVHECRNTSYGQMPQGVLSSLFYAWALKPRKMWSFPLISFSQRFFGGKRSMCSSAVEKFESSLNSKSIRNEDQVYRGRQFLNSSLRRKWPLLASAIKRSTHV